MSLLQKLSRKKSKLIVGLISGTSADGIDTALVRIKGSGIETKLQLLAQDTYPLPRGFRDFLLENSLPGKASVDIICELNILLAHFFADAVRKIAQKRKIQLNRIDLIGSHGQTVHHLPRLKASFGKRIRSTLQLGDPSTIAQLTGITTVGDFRTADMAAGGQGAPLVSYFDYVMFRSTTKNRILINLGGIANLTVVPKQCKVENVTAFDTGPANMVVDALMKKLYKQPYDRNGRIAKIGRVISYILEWMMGHEYFKRKPPKSTGREQFGKDFVDGLLRRTGEWRHEDIVATATEFTATTVYDQYMRFVHRGARADEVIVSGGGVHNADLMHRLRKKFAPIPVVTVEKLGISSDAKEAILFAVLANETIAEHPANIPKATGAKRPVILGKICLSS